MVGRTGDNVRELIAQRLCLPVDCFPEKVVANGDHQLWIFQPQMGQISDGTHHRYAADLGPNGMTVIYEGAVVFQRGVFGDDTAKSAGANQ